MGNGEKRSTGQCLNEAVDRRVLSDPPDPEPPIVLDLDDPSFERRSIGDRSVRGGGKTPDPTVESVTGRRRIDPTPVTGRSEAGDVVVSTGGEDERDRRENQSREAPAAQDHVNESPAGPPVAVDERVDGLELRMRERGLGDRRERVVVAERTEVDEEVMNLFGWRRDEVC